MTTAAIAQIDHLMIVAHDPDGLLHLFADTLDIPVAWPMADYGGFESAGVRLQNLNLEFVRSDAHIPVLALDPGSVAALRGIAFAPAGSVAETVERLGARGIDQQAPAPGMGWTNVALAGFFPPHPIFVCHYVPDILRINPDLYTDALRARDGGPLGVERVQEIVLGVPDVAEATEHWGRLLAPHPSPAPGVWTLGEGPSLRLERAPEASIARIVLAVRDLGHAVAFVRAQGLLGEESAGRATLAPERIGGLAVVIAARQG